MKRINKKGSQVDMIISFIIFVTSLLFIYFIATSLVAKPNTAKDSLGIVEDNAISSLEANVWVIRFYNSSTSGNCFSVTLPQSIANAETIAVGDSGNLPSGLSGGNVLFSGTGFIKIYYSDLLANPDTTSLSGCSQVTPDSVKEETIIPEKTIESMMSNFMSNYTLEKNVIGVPSDMDYSLSFEYPNGTVIGGNTPIPNTNVYAENLMINYLSLNGSMQEGTLGVRIW